MSPLRVVLVDDQALVRTGFAMVIGSEPDMWIAGEAADGREAIELLADVEADVVVMDIRMPVMNGIEATRLLSRRPGAPRVLVLTTFDGDEDAFAALRAGASGFLLKDASPQDLISAIRVVAAGESVVAPRITRKLLDRFADRLTVDEPSAEDTLDALTPREREVLTLVGHGLSNTEIAERLTMAEATVKVHLGRVLGKLRLRDRVQAVVFAYRHGVVRPESYTRPQ